LITNFTSRRQEKNPPTSPAEDTKLNEISRQFAIQIGFPEQKNRRRKEKRKSEKMSAWKLAACKLRIIKLSLIVVAKRKQLIA
jgi:hypothetical protein